MVGPPTYPAPMQAIFMVPILVTAARVVAVSGPDDLGERVLPQDRTPQQLTHVISETLYNETSGDWCLLLRCQCSEVAA